MSYSFQDKTRKRWWAAGWEFLGLEQQEVTGTCCSLPLEGRDGVSDKNLSAVVDEDVGVKAKVLMGKEMSHLT